MLKINSCNWTTKSGEVIEAEYRDPRSSAQKLAATAYKPEPEILKVNLAAANSQKDIFVRDYNVAAPGERKQNTNQRRATDAYTDKLKDALIKTRNSLVSSRDIFDANKSMAFRHGMNELALA